MQARARKWCNKWCVSNCSRSIQMTRHLIWNKRLSMNLMVNVMLWSFQLSYLMKTKPWSKRWLFSAAVFSYNHASNQIQEDSIFWTCTFDVLTYCWISYTIASWSSLSSESSCFRDSTQELALTRWITNNFNHEKTSTLPPSWGGGACFGIVSTIPKCIALWKRDTMSRRP